MSGYTCLTSKQLPKCFEGIFQPQQPQYPGPPYFTGEIKVAKDVEITGNFVIDSIHFGRSSRQLIVKNIDDGQIYSIFGCKMEGLLKGISLGKLTLKVGKKGSQVSFTVYKDKTSLAAPTKED